MNKDHVAVWDSCLLTIRRNISAQSFKTWFEPIKPVQLDNSALTIQVPNKFFYEWLEEHFVQLLKTTIRQELGEKGRLEYQILMSQLAPSSQRAVNQPVMSSSAYQANGNPQQYNSNNRTINDATRYNGKASGNSDSNNQWSPATAGADQIKNPFIIPGIRKIKIESGLNKNYTFDNYIEGDCNRLARSAGMAVAKKPGGTAFNPLFIFGNTGLGKTHLAQAIGNEVVKNNPEMNVLYVSLERFGNQLIQAIKNNATSELINYYLMVDFLIVDDIQFLGNRQKTQEIFFNLFNQLHQNGKQLCMTSDRPPRDLEGIEERLISRFKWGLSADVQAPDFETRMAILEAKTNREGLDLPIDVSEFICYNIKNNIRELEGVLVSLVAHSSLDRRQIDLELTKDVIKNFVTQINKEITVEFIKNLVADHFKVPADKLHGQTRKRQIVIARQLSMYLAKLFTNQSLKTIGENFGGRDHSTVIYSCKTVQDMMDTDLIFKDTVSDLEKKIKMSLNEK